ncbi:hypothetical protein MHTCC0001_00430 [Flavobacteriaceae bacterium MHTCC 0001]
MAETTPYSVTQWDTLHKNGPFDLKLLLKTELAGNANNNNAIALYNDASDEIRRLIGEAVANGEGFRAYGSRWSMSNIAHQKDRMHINTFMNIDIPVSDTDMHTNTTYANENVFFFQCGNTISEISQALARYGKSLKTSGASNGQTIAGCISTGVHGSGLDIGSVQDYVIGLNLIIGDKPEDVVYIERASRPVLNDAFAAKLNSRVIRDDKLFNVALVGLGAFGFIHGVVLEAENRFLLKRYVRKIDKNIALDLANTMDFSNSNFKIDEEVDANNKPLRPWHYKVFINPYVNDTQYVVEAIYKKDYATPYPDPFTKIQQSIYTDLIYLLIKISEKYPKTIPFFIKRLEKQILPEVDEQTIGTLYETFWNAKYKGPAFAFSFGVDHSNSSKALEALVKLTKDKGPIPGIYAMRFVKQSEATLAFTKFPITCMIEIDGIQWKGTSKLPSMEKFSELMIDTLKAKNIDFTIHWGKNAQWDYPNLCEHMFGDKVDDWKSEREKLLRPEMLRVFSNTFLEMTKLNHELIV